MKDLTIIIADDDPGHARLIEKNLTRSGMNHPIRRFENGQEVLDFLFCAGPGPHREEHTAYLLLLDVRMPKVDGVEVLRQVKGDPGLRVVPTIMLTTTDDPREVARCHSLGCNSYITKPVDSDRFSDMIQRLAQFLSVAQVPMLSEAA